MASNSNGNRVGRSGSAFANLERHILENVLNRVSKENERSFEHYKLDLSQNSSGAIKEHNSTARTTRLANLAKDLDKLNEEEAKWTEKRGTQNTVWEEYALSSIDI